MLELDQVIELLEAQNDPNALSLRTIYDKHITDLESQG